MTEMLHRVLSSRRGWRGYVLAILAVAVAVAVRASLMGAVQSRIPYVTFYPAVIIVALYGGFSAGLLTTFLSGLLVWLLWISRSMA